jgi:hypothetical protein
VPIVLECFSHAASQKSLPPNLPIVLKTLMRSLNHANPAWQATARGAGVGRGQKNGFTLVEALVIIGLVVLILAVALRLASHFTGNSNTLAAQQIGDHEAERLITNLRADCRSAKAIQAQGETLEIIRFGLDPAEKIRETMVTYRFSANRMIRQENGVTKTFEFNPGKEPDSELMCAFILASPSVLWVKIAAKNAEKSLIDQRIVYETVTK